MGETIRWINNQQYLSNKKAKVNNNPLKNTNFSLFFKYYDENLHSPVVTL